MNGECREEAKKAAQRRPPHHDDTLSSCHPRSTQDLLYQARTQHHRMDFQVPSVASACTTVGSAGNMPVINNGHRSEKCIPAPAHREPHGLAACRAGGACWWLEEHPPWISAGNKQNREKNGTNVQGRRHACLKFRNNEAHHHPPEKCKRTNTQDGAVPGATAATPLAVSLTCL